MTLKIAEHVTAVIVAYKNQMNLAISVAFGSSMQIALFITPFLVILGWIIDQPMNLSTLPLSTSRISNVRFRNFPSCGHFRVGCNNELLDYGRQVELDGRGHVNRRLYHRGNKLLALSGY